MSRPRLDRQHDTLTAKGPRRFLQKFGVADRLRIDGDLVGTRPEGEIGIFKTSHAATHRKRDEDVLSGFFDNIEDIRALIQRCYRVDIDYLVGAIFIITPGEIAGLADNANAIKLNAFDNIGRLYVEPGDDPDGWDGMPSVES